MRLVSHIVCCALTLVASCAIAPLPASADATDCEIKRPRALEVGQGEAADYEIKLNRPLKVGEKYTVSAQEAVARESISTIRGKESTVKDGFGVKLEGMVEVR